RLSPDSVAPRGSSSPLLVVSSGPRARATSPARLGRESVFQPRAAAERLSQAGAGCARLPTAGEALPIVSGPGERGPTPRPEDQQSGCAAGGHTSRPPSLGLVADRAGQSGSRLE